jgi:hypothetical protein
LAILANMIDDITEQKQGIQELSSVSDRWLNFKGEGLQSYNTANLPAEVVK